VILTTPSGTKRRRHLLVGVLVTSATLALLVGALSASVTAGATPSSPRAVASSAPPVLAAVPDQIQTWARELVASYERDPKRWKLFTGIKVGKLTVSPIDLYGKIPTGSYIVNIDLDRRGSKLQPSTAESIHVAALGVKPHGGYSRWEFQIGHDGDAHGWTFGISSNYSGGGCGPTTPTALGCPHDEGYVTGPEDPNLGEKQTQVTLEEWQPIVSRLTKS
jgi:hypothetical protein